MYMDLYIRIDGIMNSPPPTSSSYRVEMAISDTTAEGAFVWFDGVLTKMHSLRAGESAEMLV